MKRAYAKRKPSKIVQCDICGKSVRERGLVNHIRLQHQLKVDVVETVKVVAKPITINPPVIDSDTGKTVVKHEEIITKTVDYTYSKHKENFKCCRCNKTAELKKSYTPNFDRIACDKCIEQYYHNSDVEKIYVGTHFMLLHDTFNSKGERLSHDKSRESLE
jgi:hypothetical protein